MRFETSAPAKVNLTLSILGKRRDGYHALSSLVAFADIADHLSLDLGAPVGVSVSGPFAQAIAGENLVLSALNNCREANSQLRLGHVHIDKKLPVAAGIGGGSADAAATLGLVQMANPETGRAVDWGRLAIRLGADVPVCLHGQPCLMSGIGEVVTPQPNLPRFPALLINPMVSVPDTKTGDVFRMLSASPVDNVEPCAMTVLEAQDLTHMVQTGGNDLTRAAQALMPAIATVLDTLRALPNCRIARLSGAGPTCFGLFESEQASQTAAQQISSQYPGWWVQPTVLNPKPPTVTRAA